MIFYHKIKKLPHPFLVFNNNNVLQPSSRKDLGVTLDVKLTFHEHLNNETNKVNKTIGLLRELQNLLSRSTLITICKDFVRPLLNYGDTLYNQTYNSSFHETACLALTGTIRGSSKEKIYQELGFESLRVHQWCRKFCVFYKVWNNGHPQYLFNLIPVTRTLYSTRNLQKFSFLMQTKTLKKKNLLHLLPLNGTNYILALEKLRVCCFLRLTSLRLYCHFQILFTLVMILKDLVLLLDLDFT